ncbi:MAG: NAD(P)/FAD-dependent oxidoreductase [Anaerolineae bacterium]|nr:NAD(P)/FAD-dependent oxidoreductase [Anaerolineae bacterium]
MPSNSVQQRSATARARGLLGLPAPIRDLAATTWDAIVVGAGHNGLASAFYLARAGKRVLVLEARERVGGACTLEEPFPGYHVSPCAYLAGLLHRVVIDDMELPRRGFTWHPAVGGYFVPFEDGSSILLWEDADKRYEELRRFAPQDVEGYRALNALVDQAVELLRPGDERDLWLGRAPSRDQIEDRLGGDADLINLIFEWSMAELLGYFIQDERLQRAYLGQGVIGTNASPFDPGTASIRFHHASGRMFGQPGAWGYVKGGMGMVSFLMCDAAQEAGATVATGVPVAQIIPGEGVLLEGGERIHAPVVLSNADPQITLRLLGEAADPAWRAQVERVPIEGCTVKVNLALHEPPNFLARPGTNEPHHRAQINTPLTKAQWQAGYDAARRGELPVVLWTEDYLQTAFDPSIAPEGKHVLSVFSQYVPYHFAEGDWESRRDEDGQLVVKSIGRFCGNLPDAIIDMEVLGPPDIEERVGLTGGHIFQGECLPEYMWSQRLTPETPMAGVYLCGAATYPGGSVMGVNGRNAALIVLGEL